MTDDRNRTGGTLGLILCRVIVPLWILTGAIFKLFEASPRLLPKEMLRDADRLGLDLGVLLATLISLEFLAVFVIVLVGRLARSVAIFMCGVFCLVLLREILAGNTSCGCMGSLSPPPWLMLTIDGTLLLGLIVLKPGTIAVVDRARWTYPAAAVLTLAAAGTTFAALAPRAEPAPPPPPEPGSIDPGEPGPETPDGAEQPRPAPDGPLALPNIWFESDWESWIGRRWDEIDKMLIRYMPVKPSGVDEGVRFVVFYSRTCEHCEEMLKNDLAPDPELAAQFTIVEVPASPDRLTDPNGWPMVRTACETMSLPLGTDWIMTTPVIVRLENGVVTCANEGGHEPCMP